LPGETTRVDEIVDLLRSPQFKVPKNTFKIILNQFNFIDQPCTIHSKQ